MTDILKTWPVPPETPDPLLSFMDGRIYVFNPADAAELGFRSNYPDHHRNTYTIYNLRSALQTSARTAHGAWQTRSLIRNTDTQEITLTFQFTGPRDCRFKDCTTRAVTKNQGFCQIHRVVT